MRATLARSPNTESRERASVTIVVLESKARAILVWREAADRVPVSAKRLGIGVVSSVAACLDTLADADRTSGSPRDLMDRLRRLFGLSIRGGS